MAKILIVDDDQFLLQLLLDRLNMEKEMEVFGATNFSEGKRLYQQSRPELVIMDLELEDANGFSMIDWIQAKNPRQKMIIITAYNSSANQQKARERFIEDIFSKPFEMDGFIRRVKSCLAQNKQVK